MQACSARSKMLPHAAVVLDWWHVAVRFEHALQAARGLGAGTTDARLSGTAVRGLEREAALVARALAGMAEQARRPVHCLAGRKTMHEVAGTGRLPRHVAGLLGCLERNKAALVRYAARRRRGEPIATSFVERAVGEIVAWRMAKAQQTRCSRTTVQRVPNVRTAVLDGTLEDAFHPGATPASTPPTPDQAEPATA